MNTTEMSITRQMFAKQSEVKSDLIAALRACEVILDGRQPIDVPGAVMVIRSALSKAQS